jgi:hypothetical protein
MKEKFDFAQPSTPLCGAQVWIVKKNTIILLIVHMEEIQFLHL